MKDRYTCVGNKKNTVRFLKFGCAAMLLASLSAPVAAQDFSLKNLPVLEPNPDFNGVDPGSGGYTTASPLGFSAPGAGRLNVSTWFNGRRLSFSLNVYLDDQTYTRGDIGDPNERHIRVHLGGVDKLFTCYNTGPCTQVAEIDGSMLTRTTPDNYVFTDRDGAVYTFFDLNYSTIPGSCTDYESGCNAAGYQAYAYVSTIQYPAGEKLTYEPFTEVESGGGTTTIRDTIVSNLGYTLVFEGEFSGTYTPPSTPGVNWLYYRIGMIPPVMTLYLDSTTIGSLTTTSVYSSQGEHLTLTQQDGLGREYRVELHSDPVVTCGSSGTVDQTFLLPVLTVSPGGVSTTIAYHDYYHSGWGETFFALSVNSENSVPVETVTRGGNTWHYDNVAEEQTLTKPDSQTRTVSTIWYPDGYDYGYQGSECPMGRAGYKILSVEDELNRESTYDYGFGGALHLEGAILPEGNGYEYDYDGRGNLTKITQIAKPGSGLPNRVVFEAGYPTTCVNPVTCNKPEWVRDAKGLQTDYEYYATHGGVDTVTRPAARPGRVRPKTTYTYTAKNTGEGTIWRQTGSSLCIEGDDCAGTGDEVRTTTTYWSNTFLPKTKTTMAGDGSVSSIVTFNYDNAGRVTSSTDPMGRNTYFKYDAVGRNIGEISPDPDGAGPLPRLATRTTYNDDDQPTKVESGTVTGTSMAALNSMTVTSWMDTDYDTAGRKIKDTTRAGGSVYAVTQYSYDTLDRLECTAVRMNLSSVPTNACVLGAPGPDGDNRITKNEHDAAGQLDRIIRAYGTPLQQVYADYDYSDNGKQIGVVDANNNKSVFAYDGYDRRTHWYFPSETKGSLAYSPTDYEQYGYDLNDNRTSYRKRDGATLIYVYDNHDQVITKTVPERAGLSSSHTKDVYYDYDLRGLNKYSRFGSEVGQGLTHDYDALGRLESSTINLDGITRSLTYEYNANDVRTLLIHPDGQAFTYNHDGLDRLKDVTHSSAGTLATYSYDATGLLKSLNGGATTGYDFDALGRLETLQHDLAGAAYDNTYAYEYSPASQITQLTTSNSAYTPVESEPSDEYEVNGLNQYTAVSGMSLSYDDNGNLESDAGTIYLYDQENRLVTATTTGGTLKAELWYDPSGRLYKINTPAATIRLLYDGDELIAEFNGSSSSPSNRFVHGTAIDDPVAWFQGSSVTSGARRHLRANHQGSIVAVTDASGSKLYLPRYDSWGNPESTHPIRFGFTGQAWIPELSLWHYKARFYSPALGRFMQTDPIGYDDRVNLYAYVGNDPVTFTDPTGLYGCAGNGWTKKSCGKFRKAQDKAAKRIRNKAAKWRQKAAKLRGKTNPTAKNLSRAQELEDKANRLNGVADALEDDGTNGYWAYALTAQQYAVAQVAAGHPTNPDSAALAVVGGQTINFNAAHSDFLKGSRFKFILVHESLHNMGFRHQFLPSSSSLSQYIPYKEGDPMQRRAYLEMRRNYPSLAGQNPDHIADTVY